MDCKQPIHSILQVLHASAWPLQSYHAILPGAKWGTHHKEQRWPNYQLSSLYTQPGMSLTVHAVMAKPVANTDAVRAEFAKAGIPDEVTTKVTKQYKPYLRWDLTLSCGQLSSSGSSSLAASSCKHGFTSIHGCCYAHPSSATTSTCGCRIKEWMLGKYSKACPRSWEDS